jgi:hypothetical protein
LEGWNPDSYRGECWKNGRKEERNVGRMVGFDNVRDKDEKENGRRGEGKKIL